MNMDKLEGAISSIQEKLRHIRRLYDKALLYQRSDPEVALTQARKSAEALCKHVYESEDLASNGRPTEKMMLNDLIQILTRAGVLPAHIAVSLSTIQNYGNFGTHDQGKENDFITEDYVRPCLQALNTVVHWYFTKYESAYKGSDDTQASTSPTTSEGKPDCFPREATKPFLVTTRDTPGPAKNEEEWVATVSQKMVAIPPGSFIMGSNTGKPEESPAHTVNISGFFMMKCPVTQRDYVKICGTNPANFIGEISRPIESLSWFDAIAFCNDWSRQDNLELVYEIEDDRIITHFERNGYRLPTEAEWEYACRGGSTTEYFWGDAIDEANQYAWFDANSDDTTHSVGTKRKNPFGLYDMVGNVWEWVNDWFNPHFYSEQTASNPTGPEFGEFRTLRGGCWFNGVSRLRSACRLKRLPNLTDDVSGFRCVARFRI